MSYSYLYPLSRAAVARGAYTWGQLNAAIRGARALRGAS